MSILDIMIKVRLPQPEDTPSNALYRVADDLEMRDVTLAFEIDKLKEEIKQLRNLMRGHNIKEPVQEPGRILDL